MKLLRHIILLGAVTFTALVYVHQQVEMVKLSYTIDCKEKKLKEMLDRKGVLRYNISNLESPSRLEKVLLAGKVPVYYPNNGRIIKLVRNPSSVPNGQFFKLSGLEKRAGIFRLFDLLGGRPDVNVRER